MHIADVSHFVKAGSPLDREAYERATSVYLPDRVIPMLPELISNGLASLQPDRVRYTQTALLEFTPDGVRMGVEMHLGAIKSQRASRMKRSTSTWPGRRPGRQADA